MFVELINVCRADTTPQSSLAVVDIFCSSLLYTLELKDIIRFPSGNSCTNIEPIPIDNESTCTWKGYLVSGIARIVSALIISFISLISFS